MRKIFIVAAVLALLYGFSVARDEAQQFNDRYHTRVMRACE
jgi:hypothetical protein